MRHHFVWYSSLEIEMNSVMVSWTRFKKNPTHYLWRVIKAGNSKSIMALSLSPFHRHFLGQQI